jgi:predicted dehydrogenase
MGISVCIVGLGSMGRRRIRNLRTLGLTRLSGFDLSAERREAVEADGITTYASLDDALAQHPDAVVVSTPPALHRESALAAVRAGCHFFTEADVTLEGFGEILAEAGRRRLVAAPSCTMRFHPSVMTMHRLLHDGSLGRVLAFTHHCGQYLPDWHPWEDYRTFYASRRKTGACREMVPFELNWISWLVGGVDDVRAQRGKLSDLDCDIDDVYQVILRLKSGALGHMLVDVVARAATRSIRLLCEKGTVEWDGVAGQVRVYRAENKQWITIEEPPPEIFPGYSPLSAEGMYIREMKAFVDACVGVTPYPHDFSEALAEIGLLERIETQS